MLFAARWADEREVEIRILQLGVIGEDLVHQKRDRITVIISGNRVS